MDSGSMTSGEPHMTGPEHVDVHAHIAQSMTPSGTFNSPRNTAMCVDGRIRRTDVDRTPVFVHYNGKAKKNANLMGENLAISRANFAAHGWHRRALGRGVQPLQYFHVAHETLQRRLRMYDDAMEPVPDAAERMIDVCKPR
eukprot:Unigene708_Nuclearia_a/m.2237 Unigene708_Nuclearia_a/g.2237  ORF Unigene708_Nuclearia_a/g.2237 Unigene708_Nuclearia_a/m.2237 type:complete len:141 (+) Unigene708_Nuclearia_a:1844-2266(+)